MQSHKFFATLKDNFRRYDIKPDAIEAISEAYGCGYVDVRGHKESIAWKDFCEDLERAKDFAGTGVAEHLAMSRGAEISFASLGNLNDVISRELQQRGY